MLDIASALIASLRVSRLTLFYGPFGAGKTQILTSYVIPNLQITGNIPVYCNRWQPDPLHSLVQAVAESITECAIENAEWPAASLLSQSLRILSKRTNSDVLLVLDQFEEYLLYHSDDMGPGILGDELVAILTTPDLRVNVLLCFREETMFRLDCFKGQIPFLFDNRLSIRSQKGRQILKGQPTKAAAAYVFGRSQQDTWPTYNVIAYQLEDGLWYATTVWSPTGLALLAGSTDGKGRKALRVERLDKDTP